MLLDLIKFFKISEGAGGLLDFDSTMPLIGIQVLILIGVLALRLFLPIMRLQTVREFYGTYLDAVLQDTKDLIKEVYGLRSYLTAVKLALLEASKGANLFDFTLLTMEKKLILDQFDLDEERDNFELDIDIDGIVNSFKVLSSYTTKFIKFIESNSSK